MNTHSGDQYLRGSSSATLPARSSCPRRKHAHTPDATTDLAGFSTGGGRGGFLVSFWSTDIAVSPSPLRTSLYHPAERLLRPSRPRPYRIPQQVFGTIALESIGLLYSTREYLRYGSRFCPCRGGKPPCDRADCAFGAH